MVTEEKCVEFGGHCWETTTDDKVANTYLRRCKHCGKRQSGRMAQVEWVDNA